MKEGEPAMFYFSTALPEDIKNVPERSNNSNIVFGPVFEDKQPLEIKSDDGQIIRACGEKRVCGIFVARAHDKILETLKKRPLKIEDVIERNTVINVRTLTVWIPVGELDMHKASSENEFSVDTKDYHFPMEPDALQSLKKLNIEQNKFSLS